ncbi:MAG: hypothetical protein R6U98_08380 [Pirellulaceae bacterium]
MKKAARRHPWVRAVLPCVGLAADKVIRDRYNTLGCGKFHVTTNRNHRDSTYRFTHQWWNRGGKSLPIQRAPAQ